MRISLIAIAGAAIISTGCAKKMMPQSDGNINTIDTMPMYPATLLATGIDSFSYAVGLNIGESMKSQGINNINTALMGKALQSALNSDTATLLTKEQAAMTLQEKLKEFAEAKANAEKQKSLTFFEDNKKRPGVVALPNGLQYEILQAGPAGAPKPALSDTVTVNYAGSLITGVEFDSNRGGEPATFPLTGVIKGWTEILQLMPKGSKWKVYIPSELGYGAQGAGGVIPPNAPLIFNIELLDIKTAARK